MPLSQTRLLIRAAGGPQVGVGHVMRMLALGQAYRQRGGQVTFVVGDLPKSLTRRLERQKFHVFRVRRDQGGHADAQDTREIVALVQPQWIALDGYQFNDAYQSRFRDSGAKLMVMDDYLHAQHRHADIVVNQNVYATQEMYDQHHPRALVGPQFALLRDEFRQTNSTPRKFPAQARRVLVTFGGADPENWTLRTLQVLSDLNQKRLVVDCVLGNCYANYPELEEFKRFASMTLRIHKSVDRMAPLMHRADLAITGGGSTCYELARLGVPSIVTSIADNQVAVAKSMNASGAMVSIDHMLGRTTDRGRNLTQLIRRLLVDAEHRKQLSDCAQQVVDGRGALRITDRLGASLIRFRNATEADATMLWQWRNDPEVRAVSFSQEVIDLAAHQGWLQRRLHDPVSRIWVAENRLGHPIGNVRFELDQVTQRATISLIVDQAYRSRGVGTALIHAAVEKLFAATSSKEILAQIKTGNVASERAFQNAGFKPIEPVVVQGAMALQYLISRGNYRWNHKLNRKSA